MNLPEDNEKDIQRRERELMERENAIRLREIEAEIDRGYRRKAAEAEIIKTYKKQGSKSKTQLWGRKLFKVAKFSGFVIAIVILVRIALWLATIAAIGALGWVGYKVFLEEDNKKTRRGED